MNFANYKDGDVLRGTVFCVCGGHTIFEMTGQVLSSLPGKFIFAPPNPTVPEQAQERFAEARLCYFAPALRAAAVMLRASLESALVNLKYDKGTLEDRIDNALKDKVISQQDHTLAHGTRLIGNNSIHTSISVQPVEVQALFGAVTQILNKLFPE